MSIKKLFYTSILLSLVTSNAQIKNGQKVDSVNNSLIFKEQIYDFENKEIPPFELKDIHGKFVKSENLKGKPTIINFWFSTCEPCLLEIPALNELKKRYGNNVNFVAITFEDSEVVYNFLKKVDFSFFHLVNAKPYIKNFGMFGYPKTLVLDSNLIVRKIEKLIPKDVPVEKGRKELIENLSQTINGLL